MRWVFYSSFASLVIIVLTLVITNTGEKRSHIWRIAFVTSAICTGLSYFIWISLGGK